MLGLPIDDMLAVRRAGPVRVGCEEIVVLHMHEQLACRAVVESQVAARSFSDAQCRLAGFVQAVPAILGFGHVHRYAGSRRLTKVSDVFRSPGDRQQIRCPHQVIQKYLQSTVNQGRAQYVTFGFARIPQVLVHLHIDQKIPGHSIDLECAYGPEIGAILILGTHCRFHALIKNATR